MLHFIQTHTGAHAIHPWQLCQRPQQEIGQRAQVLSDDLLTIDADLHIADATGQASRLDGYVVIETKSRSKPTIADRALWHMGYRPNRFSKFGTGSALLHPELPANRWVRALRAPWTYGARKADRA